MQQAEIVFHPTPPAARRRVALVAATLAVVGACHGTAPTASAGEAAPERAFELTLSAADAASAAEADPALEAPAAWNDPSATYLQIEGDIEDAAPGRSDVGTIANDPREPSWYARVGVNVVFPQDFALTSIVTRQSIDRGEDLDDPADDRIVTTTTEEEVENTLGWGGGLYVAGGYRFNPEARISTRVEGEYQLRLNDFRDDNRTINDAVVWNSLGINGFVDFQPLTSLPELKLYGGLGGGLVYATVNNPAGAGSDDAIAPYYQVMAGSLVRFSDDIDIDFGIRWQQSVGLDVFEESDDLSNVVFHLGLLLHLE